MAGPLFLNENPACVNEPVGFILLSPAFSDKKEVPDFIRYAILYLPSVDKVETDRHLL